MFSDLQVIGFKNKEAEKFVDRGTEKKRQVMRRQRKFRVSIFRKNKKVGQNDDQDY